MKNSDAEKIRLNKIIAATGIASRRKADELILTGKVVLNGQIVTEVGTKVDPDKDKITVNGKLLLSTTEQIYIKLYKPIEVVCTVKDPQNRKTVLDLLPKNIRQNRLFPVGRLDYFSEGLLLLTNDGDFTHQLLHPKFNHTKTYEVLVREDISDWQLQTMRNGMKLQEGEQLAPIQAKIKKKNARGTVLQLVLVQGINRQIRRMCRDLQLTILQLKRIEQSGIRLNSLLPGKWAYLTQDEINKVKYSMKKRI